MQKIPSKRNYTNTTDTVNDNPSDTTYPHNQMAESLKKEAELRNIENKFENLDFKFKNLSTIKEEDFKSSELHNSEESFANNQSDSNFLNKKPNQSSFIQKQSNFDKNSKIETYIELKSVAPMMVSSDIGGMDSTNPTNGNNNQINTKIIKKSKKKFSKNCLNFSEGLLRGFFIITFFMLLFRANLYILDQGVFYHVNYKDYNCYMSNRNLRSHEDWMSLFATVNRKGMEQVMEDRSKMKALETCMKGDSCEINFSKDKVDYSNLNKKKYEKNLKKNFKKENWLKKGAFIFSKAFNKLVKKDQRDRDLGLGLGSVNRNYSNLGNSEDEEDSDKFVEDNLMSAYV